MSNQNRSFSNFANDVANSWLLPDGVVDVLFEDAHKQEVLRHRLTQQLITHGYQLVNPPMIEFTESLLSDASEDLKRQTFKIIDQLTGRLMGVRADITPQILRIDAHWGGTGIARYCYAGDVIHTLPSGLFGSRTPLQLGAEIFGCASLAADIELVDV
ncbi:MAG: ATP phosphoribosyltransferase regulatory subunit, partial [Psychrobacter alimentarius]